MTELLPYISNTRLKQRDTLVSAMNIQNVPNLPGLYYVKPFDENTVNNIYWPHLRTVQPPWIAVLGAEQLPQAQAFARDVQNDPIRTNVIFAHWAGVLGSPNHNGRLNDLTAAQWMERVGIQHVNAPYWVLADNEGLGATVVQHTADLIPRASSVHLKLAVGAWSSHNPKRADWPLYMPVFQALYEHPEHVYAPHIYYSGLPKSVENLDGFKLVADHLAHIEAVMGAPIPFQVVIGEYGRLANPTGAWLDPDKGYVLEGLDEVTYADELIRLAAPYRRYWDFIVFSRGAWGTRGSLGVGRDYEARMKQYADGILDMPEVQGDTPLEYPEMTVVLRNGAVKLRMRPDPSTNQSEIVILSGGETLHYDRIETGQALTPGGSDWLRVYHPHRLIWGYVFAYYLDVPADAYLPPSDDPPPPPTGDYVTRAEVQALLNRLMALEKALSEVVAAYGEGHVKAAKLVEVYPKAI